MPEPALLRGAGGEGPSRLFRPGCPRRPLSCSCVSAPTAMAFSIWGQVSSATPGEGLGAHT